MTGHSTVCGRTMLTGRMTVPPWSPGISKVLERKAKLEVRSGTTRSPPCPLSGSIVQRPFAELVLLLRKPR